MVETVRAAAACAHATGLGRQRQCTCENQQHLACEASRKARMPDNCMEGCALNQSWHHPLYCSVV
jgi:hypothetical protein